MRRFSMVLALVMVAACSDEEPTSSLTPAQPIEGRQGEGTSIPSAEGESTTPSAPATRDPSPADDGASEEQQPAAQQPPAAPTKKVLDATWFGQETTYWCGPGSTRIALSARIQTPPSQTALAGMLGTTTNGTDHIGLVANVLNKQFGGAGYVSRPIFEPPTKAQRDQLKKDVLARIGSGFPIVANVISGWRPPGYPGGTIYHYVAVIGFDDGGDKVLIGDPAAKGSGGAGFNALPGTYWISLFDLGTWIGGKGYTG